MTSAPFFVSFSGAGGKQLCAENLAFKNCERSPGSYIYIYIYIYIYTKGKSVPLQAWSGPGGSRKFMFPDFMTTSQDGGKVVSLTHRPPLPPGNAPDTNLY